MNNYLWISFICIWKNRLYSCVSGQCLSSSEPGVDVRPRGRDQSQEVREVKSQDILAAPHYTFPASAIGCACLGWTGFRYDIWIE